jgi:hypothetical protein
MAKVKIVLCNVLGFFLLCILSVPAAHAQNFEIDGGAKFKTKIYTNANVEEVKAGGKGYVMLFENGFVSECDGFGFSYDIVLIENADQEGAACILTLLGFLDTCAGEQSAVGTIAVGGIPEETTNYALCFFNGPVDNGQTFSSKGGECDLYDIGDNWIGISKLAKFKLKEKNLEDKIKCVP